MISCTASAAWSRPVLSLCYTEPDPSRGAVLSGRITTVAMSRSGQLGRRCTVEKHCSGLHVCRRLSNARACLEKHASLAACLGQLSLSLFLRAMGHVTAPELLSQEGRARSRGTRGSTGAHLVKQARSGADGHVAASELTSARRRGLEPWDTWQHP
jgi:hypothetical protein